MAVAESIAWADALTLLPLDGDTIAFSERTQKLISLNPAAEFIIRELQRGSSQTSIVDRFVRQGAASAETAGEWVRSVRESLVLSSESPAVSDMGADDPATAIAQDSAAEIPPYRPFTAKLEKRYRLLDVCYLVRYALRDQMNPVDAVIGHLASDEAFTPTDVIDIRGDRVDGGHIRSQVYRNREPIGEVRRPALLGPFVKSMIWQSAVKRYDFLFYLHAGVVGTGERCILFPAAAGSGKSSLTAAMTHRGYRYYSDEVALVQRQTFHVPPMPLAICVKDSGWEVMSKYFPNIANLFAHRRGDGKLVRYVPPPEDAASHQPAPVSHIVFPRYAKDGSTHLKPLRRAEALGRLMGECLALGQRLDRENVARIVNWMAGIDCYSLEFSSLDDAVELIAQVAPLAR